MKNYITLHQIWGGTLNIRARRINAIKQTATGSQIAIFGIPGWTSVTETPDQIAALQDISSTD